MKMEFKKNKYEYYREYNKLQAIKALKDDNRIQEIFSLENKMIVITKPIIPTISQFPELMLCSVGKFQIEIEKKTNSYPPYHKQSKRYPYKLYVNIIRLNGCICDGWEIPHVRHDLHSDRNHNGMHCWGNVQGEVDQIKKNLDWYWLVKKSLNLIEDFKDNSIDTITMLSLIYFAQVKFNPKIKTKLKKKILKYIKDKDFMENLWDKKSKIVIKELIKSLGLTDEIKKFDLMKQEKRKKELELIKERERKLEV